MPPLGRSPDSRSAGFLKEHGHLRPIAEVLVGRALAPLQSATCSSSKTIVLPRGLTWANPLGSTVPTRHTLAGNAVFDVLVQGSGNLGQGTRSSLDGTSGSHGSPSPPPVNGPCYPGDDDRPPPLDHWGIPAFMFVFAFVSSGGARRGGQGDHAGLRGQRHHRRAALRHVLLRLRRLS